MMNLIIFYVMLAMLVGFTPVTENFAPLSNPVYQVGCDVDEISYDSAIYEFRNQNWPKAIDILNCLITANPDEEHLYTLRIVAHILSNDITSAFADIQSLMKLDPNSSYPILVIDAVNSDAHVEQDLESITNLLQTQPENLFLHHRLEVIHAQAGSLSDALNVLDILLVDNPDSALIHAQKGFILSRIGEDGEDHIQYAQQLDPQIGKAYVILGWNWLANEHYENAIRFGSRAIRTSPQLPEGYQISGLGFYGLSNYFATVAYFYDFEQNGGDIGNVAFSMAYSLFHLEEYELALSYFEYLSDVEVDPLLLIFRGEINRKLSNYEKALLDFDQAIAISPDNASAYAIRGALQYDIGELDGAITDYQQAIQLAPSETIYLLDLARLYSENTQYAEAISLYQEFIEQNDDPILISTAEMEIERLLGLNE
jgi:tetratricopeptide (TPR) repeat protein